MKQVLSAIGILLFIASPSLAADEPVQPVKAEADTGTLDCSKETWPNFSPSCLRKVDKAVNVRVVTSDRR
jgi:hypothetical protein